MGDKAELIETIERLDREVRKLEGDNKALRLVIAQQAIDAHRQGLMIEELGNS